MTNPRRRVRRIVAAAISGIAAAGLLAACGMSGASGNDSGEAQTDLTIGLAQLAPSVDLAVDGGTMSRFALTNVYDRLVNPDGNGGWTPNAATEWEFNEDNSELTFTLRDDITFTNGEKLDANAVKYSVDRILDPENKSYALGTLGGKFEGVEVIDDTHVKFLVKNNDATAMLALSLFFIVPPEHAEATGMGLGGEGIGSGPMMIDSFSPNDHLTLVPNPDYWGDPVDNLTEVTFLSIEDEAARSSALDSGRADIVLPMSPDIWSGLESSATAKPVSSLLGHFQNIFLGKYDKESPLNDLRVRQAVNYAIDKDLIVESILLGSTYVPSQMVPEGSAWYNEDLDPWPYDPEKAKELLAEAGYADGFEVDFESTTGRTPADKEVGAAIVEMLGDVGIKADWQITPGPEWINHLVTGSGATLYMTNTGLEPSMMPEATLDQWTSTSFTKVMNDPEYDALMAEVKSTSDEAARAKLAQEASAMVLEKQPIALLYQVPMLFGVNKSVDGFAPGADMSFDLRDITIGG